MSDVLAVTGNVLPVTLEDVKLCAELIDGYIVCGESKIGKHHNFHPGAIRKVYLEPLHVKPLQEALDAISEADVLVLGPGSLYTSIIANLLVNSVNEMIKKSKAIKVYVCNVMTQPGETDGYSVSDHIRAIERHSYEGIVDYCIINTAAIPEELKENYEKDGAELVKIDYGPLNKLGVKLIGSDLVGIKDNHVRHDPERLARAIINLVAEKVLSKDKRRVMDYYYVKERLKKIISG